MTAKLTILGFHFPRDWGLVLLRSDSSSQKERLESEIFWQPQPQPEVRFYMHFFSFYYSQRFDETNFLLAV